MDSMSMSIIDSMSSCMAVMFGMQVQSMTPSMVIEPPVAEAAPVVAGAAVVGAVVVVGAVSATKTILGRDFYFSTQCVFEEKKIHIGGDIPQLTLR